jgi:hypothetical protein
MIEAGRGAPDRDPGASAIGREDSEMDDLFFIAVIIVFFAIATAFARGCEQLEKEE